MNDFCLFTASYVQVSTRYEQQGQGFSLPPGQPKALPLTGTTNIHDWPVPLRSDESMVVEEEPFRLNASLGIKGVFVAGGTGSGKTSGPMFQMEVNLLQNKCGGLVLCAKDGEAEQWRSLAEKTGRTNDLIFLSQERFDFVAYENERHPEEGGGITENIVNSILEMADLGRGAESAKGDHFWEDAAKELLRNTIDFLKFTQSPVNLIAIREVITAAPKNQEDFDPNADLSAATKELIEKLHRLEGFATEDEGRKRDAKLVCNYFLIDFPRMGGRVNSGIQATVSSLIDGLSRGELGNCFAMGECSIKPESILAKNQILICDFDIKRYERLGRLANAIIKYIFQKAIERRKDKNNYVFLYADEAQFFATQYDQKFQTTARSSKCITIYATQTLSNYYAEIGRDRTSALLGNLQTKIFCQNSDPETNEWASKLVGKAVLRRKSHANTISSVNACPLSESNSDSVSEQMDYVLPDNAFTSLRMGGPEECCRVEAILINPFVNRYLRCEARSRLPQYLLLRFNQDCQEPCSYKKNGEKEACGRLSGGVAIRRDGTPPFSKDENSPMVFANITQNSDIKAYPMFFATKAGAHYFQHWHPQFGQDVIMECRIQGEIATYGVIYVVERQAGNQRIFTVYGNKEDAVAAAGPSDGWKEIKLEDIMWSSNAALELSSPYRALSSFVPAGFF